MRGLLRLDRLFLSAHRKRSLSDCVVERLTRIFSYSEKRSASLDFQQAMLSLFRTSGKASCRPKLIILTYLGLIDAADSANSNTIIVSGLLIKERKYFVCLINSSIIVIESCLDKLQAADSRLDCFLSRFFLRHHLSRFASAPSSTTTRKSLCLSPRLLDRLVNNSRLCLR